MTTVSNLTLRRALVDPPLRESLLVSAVMLMASGGLTLLLTWLWVLREALREHRELRPDWLVVCGYVLEDGVPSEVFVQRLRRAASLASEHPGTRLVIAGGGQPSEAAVGREWLVERAGLDPANIVLEEASTDTFANLRHARGLLPKSARLGIVTSRFHLARVMIYARQLGLDAVPVPAETRWRLTAANLSASLRESAFLCWFLCGRFWARLANREPLLERLD